MAKDRLEKIISDKLSGLQVNPPAYVWEGIMVARKRKIRLLYFRVSAAAAVLLVLVSLPFMLTRHDSLPEKNTLTNTEIVGQPDSHAKSLPQDAELSYNASINTSDSEPLTHKTQLAVQSNRLLVRSDFAVSTEKTEVESTLELTEIQHEVIIAESADTDPATQLQQKKYQEIDALKGLEIESAGGNSKKFQLTLAYQGTPSGSMSGEDFNLLTNASKFGPDPFQSSMAYRTSFYKEIESTDVRPPMSFGFKLSYYTTDRLSIESGLLFTELSTISKTLEMNSAYHEFEQSLYYIGLPVGLRYDIFKRKTFTVYVAQSVVFEKGVRAINKVYNYEKSFLKSSEKSVAPINGFQLSTLSAVGLDIPMFAGFSFFGEGGFQVFYLNHTQPFNIRSAKPLWPVMHAGVRFKK